MISFCKKVILAIVGFWLATTVVFAQQAPSLGALYDFSALGHTGVTNLENTKTVISADLGVSAGAITGFPPGEVLRGTYVNDTKAKQANQDAIAAFNHAASQPVNFRHSNANLGKGLLVSLSPGVYELSGNTLMSGELILDGENNPSAIFIFRVKGNLDITNLAQMTLKREASSAYIYWIVDGEITAGNHTGLKGNFIAKQNIVLGDGALLQGRIASLYGGITFTNNILQIPADLEVTLQKSPGANGANLYVVGESITYTIKARNNGPVDEANVRVTGLQFTGDMQSFTSSRAGATFDRDPSSGMWVWSIGSLRYKEEVTLTITATINTTGSGFARASIQGAGVDEIRFNNAAELNYCVVLPNAGIISGPSMLCFNTSGTYSINPVPGARYSWNKPSDWTIDKGLGTNEITVTAGRKTGVISVTINNTCGESLPSMLEVGVFADPPVKPGLIAGEDNVCIGTPVTYTIDPVKDATTYQWILPDGWTMQEDNGTSVTVLPGGANTLQTIQVRAINVCGVSDPSTRDVQPFLTTPVMPGPITGRDGGSNVCATRATATYSIPPQNDAISYRWSVPGTWKILSGQGTASISAQPSAEAGVITVVAVNACGPGPARTFEVNPVTAVPDVPGVITGPTSICLGSDGLKYTITPVVSANSYTWYVPSGWTIVSGQNTSEITVRVGATASSGKISVQATNNCGASSIRSLDVATVANKPIAPLVIRGKSYGCATKSFTYETDPVAGASTYNWEVPGDWEITAGQGTTRITVTMGSMAGNVTVRASNACGSSADKSMAVAPFITTPIPPFAIKGPSEVCATGQQNVVYSLDPVDNTLEYIWAVPSGWTIAAGQGSTSITVLTGTSGGTITVMASNECGASAPASLTVNPSIKAPTAPARINGEMQVCVRQQDLTYSIDPVPGAVKYIWSISGAGWNIESGNGTTSIKVTAGTTQASISVVAENGCNQKSPAQTAVILFRNPPVTPGPIVGSSVPCTGINYTYSVGAVAEASSYIWQVPAGWEIIGASNGSSITVKPGSNAGSIKVRASNSCGTSSEQSLDVAPSANTPITLGPIKGEVNTCAKGSTTYSVDPVQGASAYNWTVPEGWTIKSGEGTATIVVEVGSAGGVIKVTPKNDCGPGAAQTRNVSVVNSVPIKPEPIQGATVLCAGSPQVFSVQPSAGVSSYTWSFPSDWVIVSGQGTSSVTVTSGKTAGQVTVTARNGCGTSSNSLNVRPSDGVPPPAVEIVNKTGPFCGSPKEVTFSIAGIAEATGYTWEVPSGWKIISGQNSTSITVETGNQGGEVKVSASNACGKGISKALYVAPQQPIAAPATIQGPALACTGSTETVYSVAAIAGADSYLWSLPLGWEILSGAGTNSIRVRVSGAGTIGVRAKNSCGTTSETTLQVSVTTGVPQAPSEIRGETILCSTRTVTYAIDAAATASRYTWQVPAGWKIISGEGTTQITVQAGNASGNVSVTADNSCGPSATRTLAVTAAPMASIGAITDRSTPCVGLVYEVAPVDGAKKYTWTLPEGWTITSGQGTNRISVQAGTGKGNISVVADNDVCLSEPATLTPDPSLINSDVTFPNVFSPNNDGTNDTWEIANLLNYPDNDLTIINRWGNEVYRSKSYRNNWNGDNLTEGTYYYIARVKLCDGTDKVFRGFVMIVR